MKQYHKYITLDSKKEAFCDYYNNENFLINESKELPKQFNLKDEYPNCFHQSKINNECSISS